MNVRQATQASTILTAVLSFVLVASVAMAAGPPPAQTPAAGEAVLVNTPTTTVCDPLQAGPALVPADQAGPAVPGAPAAAAGMAPEPAKTDGDAMISEGQALALQGAATGDRLMVRAGRRMIRDGALLKKSQQLAQ